jgi:hypothetical protein
VTAGQRQALAVNLNAFHVLQTVAAASADLDAGVPARSSISPTITTGLPSA